MGKPGQFGDAFERQFRLHQQDFDAVQLHAQNLMMRRSAAGFGWALRA
jgi:hypothetical protein